jgi:hypothetical protein
MNDTFIISIVTFTYFLAAFVFLISIAGYFIEYIIIGDALFEKL